MPGDAFLGAVLPCPICADVLGGSQLLGINSAGQPEGSLTWLGDEFSMPMGRGISQQGPRLAYNNMPTFLCLFKASKPAAAGAVSTAEAALAVVALVQLLSIRVMPPPGGMVWVCLVGLQKRGLAPSVAKGAHTMGVCSLFGTCGIQAVVINQRALKALMQWGVAACLAQPAWHAACGAMSPSP